jgi:anti-sigma regulatory factor (Ser/Thr protein kinase)
MVYLEARDDLVATAAYQPVPAAAAAARRFVRDTLRSWELAGDRGSPGERAEWTQRDALVDDAVLLTSELVTNAVLHAGTPVQVTCRLLGDLSDGAVEIAVLDRRPAQLRPDRPHTAAEAAERTNGRGLQLPFELATAWGVTYARAAKAVWFRLDLAGRGRPAVPVPPPVSVPEQPDAAGRPAAESSPDADIPAPRTGESPGTARFDDLLVSTVESARDAIGADTAYLLHAGKGAELRAGEGAELRAGKGAEPHAEKGAEPRAGEGAEPHAGKGAEPHAGEGAELRAGDGAEPHAGQGAELHAGDGGELQAEKGAEPHAGEGAEPQAGKGGEPHAGEGGARRVRAAAADGGRSGPGRAGLPASAARALAHGALSLVTVPLMVDGRVTGVLAAAAAEPGRFSESDASRLQDLADRSAPLLERARLSAAWPT